MNVLQAQAHAFTCFALLHLHQPFVTSVRRQRSLITLFQGPQLVSEALGLCGVQLLVAEECFPGPQRERLLVAFYRHGFHRAELSAAARADVDKVRGHWGGEGGWRMQLGLELGQVGSRPRAQG